jgi:hypothetical protein
MLLFSWETGALRNILLIDQRATIRIPANFPDSGGIFTILTILPDFPIGIFKILYFPDFLSLSPVLRQSTTNLKFRATLSGQPIRIRINSRHY